MVVQSYRFNSVFQNVELNILSKQKESIEYPKIWEVEGNADLLTVILVRLPAKSILRFQCVSKRWNKILLAPFFFRTFYSLRKEFALAHRMVGYIQEIYHEGDSDNSSYRIIESIKVVAASYEGLKLIDEEVQKKDSYFVNTSNGLILFQIGLVRLLIVNPISSWAFEVPHMPPFNITTALALVCEENMLDLVLNYKIILATKIEKEHSYLTINTFCSKTRKWIESIPTTTGSLNDVLHRLSTPLVVDYVIYWFTHTRLYLVVYYMETNMIQLVELPSECGQNYSSRVARSSNDDDLWLCVHMAKSCCIRFWMVPSKQCESYRLRSSSIPSNAWILMHEFNYPAPTVTPELAITPRKDVLRRCVCRSWWRGGVRRTVPYVDFYITKHCDPNIYNRYAFYPYMEPLTLSSYSI